ncbi:hypothetical protein SCOR_14395 [Sulfidibacter corallicola]
MGELQKNLVRVVGNFTRLGIGLMFGLLLVRLQLSFGQDAFSIIILLGTTVGYLRIFPDIIQHAVIAELSRAYHSEDRHDMSRAFAAAGRVSALIGLTILTAVSGFALVVDQVFNIPVELLGATRYLTVCIGIQTMSIALFAPCYKILEILERFTEVNFWHMALKLSFLFAAGLVLLFVEGSQERFIICYGTLSTLFFGTVMVSIMLRAMHLLPHATFFRRDFCRDAAKRMLRTGVWNTVSNVSMVSQVVFGAFMANRFFGIHANGMYGLAIQLGGYVRMCCGGLAYGLDSIAARVLLVGKSSRRNQLIEVSTAAHAWAVLTLFPMMVLFPQEILTEWIGPQSKNPQFDYAMTANLIRLFAFGAMFHGISDAWDKILIGAGRVASYARLQLGITILAIPLSLAIALKGPEGLRFFSLSFPYTLFYPLFGLWVFPWLLSLWTQQRRWTMYRPLFKTFAVTLLPVSILFLAGLALPAEGLGLLLLAVLFGTFHVLSSGFLLVPKQYRRMGFDFLMGLRSRFGGSAAE